MRLESGNHFGAITPVGTFVTRRASPPSTGDDVQLRLLVFAALGDERDQLAVRAPRRRRVAARRRW